MSPAPAPEVVLEDGDEASGMATMIAGLLADNLRDFPGRARVARRTRGSLVLNAADRGMSITLSFGPSGIAVSDGAKSGAPVMAGPWLTMSRVCSGQTMPLKAMADRELKVTWGRSMWVVPAAGFVLSVPASFYEDDDSAGKRRLVVVAALVVAVLVMALLMRIVIRRKA